MNRRQPRISSLKSRLLDAAAPSLERRLALVMSGVLAGILITSLALTYGTLTRAAESSARERITRAVWQVAASAEAATELRERAMREWIADSAFRSALARAGARGEVRSSVTSADESLTAVEVLRTLRPHLSGTDTLTLIHLRRPDGGLVAAVGPMNAPEHQRALDDEISRRLASGATPDVVTFTPMHQSGDRYYFWAVAPVLEGDSLLGFICQLRRVGGPENAQAQLRDLIGEHVAMFLRNSDGEIWASWPGSPGAAPARRHSGSRGLFHDRSDGRMIAEEAVVAGTPWLLVMETPLSRVYAGAMTSVFRLALLSVLLMTGGVVLSWAIGRKITRPLASLTAAAEAIAGGHYERRVGAPARGRDEIGRLSQMFDQMAGEVESSRQALERQVSEARQTARALELANVQLRDAVALAEESRGEAERARAQAERANRAKGDFLAVMSHELRTPLNAIGGYAQLLGLGVYGPLTEAQQDALARLGRSQVHLLRLVNDVLDLAKIDAGEVSYEMERVPVNEVLARLEPLVAPQIQAKSICYEQGVVDDTVAVRADREKLQQVLLNLLANAAKYTPEGGRVRVEASAEGRRVRIRVEDTGVGIPQGRLSSIFDRFVQGERSLSTPDSGVGLGLTISRDLARGMGGDLTVESAPGKGSVFTVELERYTDATRSSPSPAQQRAI